MKFLVTGGTGFIGQNLVARLQSHAVEIFHRDQDIRCVLERIKPDCIINCAAEIYDANTMWATNVELVRSCLEWQKDHTDVQMLHLGSSSEYGVCSRASRETDAINPTDMYSGTKGIATILCQTYARSYGLDVTVIRPYSPYGPGERSHRLFPRLWQAFVLGREMELVQGVHDFCYIDDFIDAVITVIQSDQRQPGEIINVSNGQQHTNQEVLACFETVSGKSAPVTLIDRFVTPSVWLADTTLIRTKYGWQPKYDLERGIARFIGSAHYE